MSAITKESWSGEAAIRAIEAGSDIILLPLDVERTIDSIYEAVLSNRIDQKRIDFSVNKILNANGNLRKIILSGGIGPVIPAIIFLFFFFAMPLVVLCAFGFVSIDRGIVDWTTISLDHLISTIKDSLFFWNYILLE